MSILLSVDPDKIFFLNGVEVVRSIFGDIEIARNRYVENNLFGGFSLE